MSGIPEDVNRLGKIQADDRFAGEPHYSECSQNFLSYPLAISMYPEYSYLISKTGDIENSTEEGIMGNQGPGNLATRWCFALPEDRRRPTSGLRRGQWMGAR